MSIMVVIPEPNPVNNIEMFHCTFCKKSFYYKRYLVKHMQRMHNVTKNKIPLKLHKCGVCEKSFTTKRYMHKHRINIHNVNVKRSIKCREENCNCEFSTLTKFRIHLDFVHNFADYSVPDKLRFSSLTDFMEWLVSEEKNSKCKFIRPRGRFKRTSYTRIDYTCSQNRYFFSNSSTKDSIEIQDPKKTRQHCTAQILVKVFDDHVEAVYFKRHYKHDSFLTNPKLLIRRKKAKKVEKKVENIASVYEAAVSLKNDEQHFSETVDTVLTNTSQGCSSDLYVEALIKQLNTIHSKLLSKTSMDIHIALTISDSLKNVENILDYNMLSDNKESDKKSESQRKRMYIINRNQKSSEPASNIDISLNEMFVSTSPSNDHDYNKI